MKIVPPPLPTTIRVYSFRCYAPTQGAELLRQQLHLAHGYYNALIAEERKWRLEWRERCDTQSDELYETALQIEACLGELAHARSEAGGERMRARSRKGASDATREDVRLAKEALAVLRERRNALISTERRRDPAFRDAFKLLEEKCYEAKKCLYSEWGDKGKKLHWGTQGEISKSVEQACKIRGADGKSRTRMSPPHFRSRPPTEGLVAVQLQRRGKEGPLGLLMPLIFGDDTRLQIDQEAGEAAMSAMRTSARRRATRIRSYEERADDQGRMRPVPLHERLPKVRMRVGKTEAGEPLWLEFPVVLHRQLPRSGLIKWAKILVRRLATGYRYELQLTVEIPAPSAVPVIDECAVGIDLGWRWQDAIRVAYTAASDGSGGPVSMPNTVIKMIEHANSLRAIRDRNYDGAKADLGDWLKAHKEIAPPWLLERTKNLAQWGLNWRLPSLLRGGRDFEGWQRLRFSGDEGIFTALVKWHEQDEHIWKREAHIRENALRQRQEQYRVWAAGIASRYTFVAIEDFDLRKAARGSQLEEQGEYDDLARQQRIMSAPSSMRDALVNACRSRGVTLVKVPAEYSTMDCHACGARNEWDAATFLHHRCTACGAIWDQDANAAINLLRRGLRLWHETEQIEADAPRIGRWAKRRLLAAEARTKLSAEK